MPMGRLAIVVVLVISGCGGQAIAPSVALPAATSPGPVPSVGATEPSITVRATAPPLSESPPPVASKAVNGKITFVRYDTTADAGSAFTIDPDGTHEKRIGHGDVGCSDTSPDDRTLLCSAWFARTGARPAIAALDGSGFRVLDAYPNRTMSLNCTDWTPDGTRFLCVSDWDRNASKADFGLYTVRATDGGDLHRLTTVPAGCVDGDQVPSPDWTHILFDRICGADEHGTLYDIRMDGSDLVRLSQPDVSISDPFGSLAADWSPDGSRVAFGAYVPAADSTALFIVDSKGAGVRQVVSTDTGAVSARWSPDGQWIAFTSRYRSRPQVWRVHPDGSGLARLTDPSDGSNAVSPMWSPDGTRILYAKDEDAVINTDRVGRWSLWTMAADGTARTHLTDTLGAGMWWLSAAGSH